MPEKYKHIPVLLDEVIENLNLKSNQNVIDCTVGGGGHAEKILEKIKPKGKLIGIDLDEDAIKATKKRLSKKFGKRLILINESFANLTKIKDERLPDIPIDNILLDLGVSSAQLEDEEKGFAFSADSLDFRMDKHSRVTAEKIINKWPQKRLEQIFKDYGEERLVRPIAQEIVQIRKQQKIESPSMLVKVITGVYKKFYKTKSKKNPATKVFQALRIAVNDELENLKKILPTAVEILQPKGRVAVISFHSLEDRIVKNFFRQESKNCICPAEIPICRCEHEKRVKLITKKPIIADDEELKRNPRSRSAKLRVVEKL